MQIIDAEEAHMLEWLGAQRDTLEAQIKDMDILRASSKLLLQVKKWPATLTSRLTHENVMMEWLQKYDTFIFL